MPTHLKRVCSAIDDLPSDLDFEVSQQSELQFEETPDLQSSQQSGASSQSSLEGPSGKSLAWIPPCTQRRCNLT